ncbi:hypothetical protein HGI30_14205 [Paenibacillus albicereus]|uniref:Anti-sigma-W factor RsiW n=2 Tax=Paenibacillus albicereus TaxID=2726185 RepID=A0A6H2GYT8_9BACL|nr:hypothetical protein HGI30_14205 [Paenibacillus albicereus]
MNRYLDGDLDELERQELMDHLRHCPDDQELFERLQRLSGELEELPKITPPFSLVDSILPQLEEIDAHRDAKASASQAAEATSARASEAGGQPARRPAASRFNRRARVWTGSVAAAAAAALILVLAPWGTGPDSPLTAEINNAADTGGQEASTFSAGDAAAPASGLDSMQSQKNEGSPSAKQQIVDGQTVPTATTPPESGSAEPRAGLRQEPPAESPSVSAGGGQGSTVYPSPGADADRESAQSAPPKASLNFAGPSPGVVSGIMGDTDMGIAAVPEVTYSPNQQFSYSISHGWIVITKADGGKVFDHTFDGAVSDPAWSEDSRYLSVTVTDKDGTSKPYRIDVQDGALVE